METDIFIRYLPNVRKVGLKMIGKEVRGFKLDTMEMVDWLNVELQGAAAKDT